MPPPVLPPDTQYNPVGSLDYDPGLAEALGNLIVAWSDAERSLQAILILVSGMSPAMSHAGYIRIPTFESRVRYLRALLEEWDDPKRDDIVKAIDKLRSLSTVRNDWVHGSYARGRNNRSVTVFFDFRERISSRLRVIKANDIRIHCDAVRDRTDRIYELAGYQPTTR